MSIHCGPGKTFDFLGNDLFIMDLRCAIYMLITPGLNGRKFFIYKTMGNI